jgi:two-component system sensor histidine kinase KdpD
MLTTGVLWSLRPLLDKAHIALAFLLLVLAGSGRAGRPVGIALAVASFLSFDFFLLPPYYTLTLADPRDWGVLFAFVLTASVAATLLDRALRAADSAEARAREVERLAEVGAETLSAGSAEEALRSVLEVIRATLDLEHCEVCGPIEAGQAPVPVVRVGEVGPPTDGGLVRYVLDRGAAALVHADGTVGLATGLPEALRRTSDEGRNVTDVILPLAIGGRTVGALRLGNPRGISLTPVRCRFGEALAYYAALGVERVRLLRDAERLQVMQETDRMKDALLAAVSHDLRTPLTSIKAFACQIAEGGDARAEAIVSNADRLNRFVSDLLDLSRLDSGGVSPRPEYTPADDLVGEAAAQVAGLLAEQDELCIRLPQDQLLVGWFDPVHALRALSNLVENACRHAPAGTPVELTVHRSGGDLHFDVEDRGPGLPPEERERVFQPFYQVRPGAGGVGLGLSIARRMARAQGGDVTYAPRPGGGSRFCLTLPAADVPADALEAG